MHQLLVTRKGMTPLPVCLLLMSAGLANCSASLAQQNGQQSNVAQLVVPAVTTVKAPATTNKPVSPKRPLKNTENPEFKSERVTKAMDLPDMPVYQGKKTKFVTGTIFRQVKGGASLTEQFSVSEPKLEVLQWYKDAFAANKWVVLDNMAGADGVAASKNNNICQILTIKPTNLGYKTDVLVRYKFYKATKF